MINAVLISSHRESHLGRRNSRLGRAVLVMSLVAVGAGCTEPGPSPAPGTSPPADGSPAVRRESELLKREMITALVEHQRPDASADERKQFEDEIRATLDEEMSKSRKHNPEFLFLSAAEEAQLQAGNAIADSAERVASLKESLGPIMHTRLLRHLLAEHAEGKLSPIRTELLAQLLLNIKKARDAALAS